MTPEISQPSKISFASLEQQFADEAVSLFSRSLSPVVEAMRKISWQLIHVADVEQMPFVEIRTGPVLMQVVRIDQNWIAAIGSIVNRVAVGIRDSGSERAARAPQRRLKCVIARIGHILQ